MEHRLRFGALLLVCSFAFAAGCGGESTTITKNPPDLAVIEPHTAGFGDTLTVTGSGFNRDLDANRIVLSTGSWSDPAARRVVVPFFGSKSELRGIVPDGAFTGSVRVEDCAPLSGFPLLGPQPTVSSNAVSLSIRLDAGEVGKAFFAGTSYVFAAAAGPSSEDYLVVLFSDAEPPSYPWTYLYTITAFGNAAAQGGPGEAAASRGIGPVSNGRRSEDPVAASLFHDGEHRREFDRRIAEETRRLLDGTQTLEREGTTRIRPSLEPGAPAATADFKVLRSVSLPLNDPASYRLVTADLKYTGSHVLLYVDVTTPPANITQSEAEAFGRVFDENIYPTNRATFGNESDINGDGRVAILMSPAVNLLTDPGSASTRGFIAGYFLPNDLLPGLVPAGATNAMEVFYTIVPDPTGEFGNVYPKDKVIPIIEGVLAHEFQHMIIFNYRVLIYGHGVSGLYIEDIWLDEGLAHIAEDVNGYAQSNIARANLFLADPGSVTLIYGGDSLEERGASFLFLRLLGDRFGASVFRSLVQSRNIGTANIEAATGSRFKELFADWSAALYLSGRGITDDPRFNYASIDIQGDFNPPYVAVGVISPAGMNGSIASMAPEYILYTVPASAGVDFSVEGEASGRFNAVVVRIR